MNMDTNVAIKLAQAALDKGYGVRIFGYGEAVTLIKDGQDPKRFPNVGKETKELVGKGLEVVVCKTCCKARGIRPGRGDRRHQDREPDQRPVQVRGRERPHGDHREVMKWQRAYWY